MKFFQKFKKNNKERKACPFLRKGQAFLSPIKILFTLIFFLNFLPSASSTTLKIMCLGDSITYGMPNDVTVDAYRTDLGRLLSQAGWQFEFTNCGHPGASSAKIDSYISSDLAGKDFDIVLYNIGTNDITFGNSFSSSIFYIRKTIETILASGVQKVYLSAVQPRYGSLHNRQNTLAQLQRELVAEFRYANKSVFLADHNGYFLRLIDYSSGGNWVNYYLSDGKHPNDAGYLLMAECWFDTMTDSVPPDSVTDLKVEPAGYRKLKFTWTAPGDNQKTNRVLRYILKQSFQPISENNWNEATNVSEISSLYPSQKGTIQSITISNLTPDKLYYFALKSEDNNGNLSSISNVVQIFVSDDSSKPEIKDITFDGNHVIENDYISSKPLIKGVIHDLPRMTNSTETKAVNPSTIRIKIDGVTVTDGLDASGYYDSWDFSTETLTYQVKKELSPGKHSFKIEATDYSGNVMPVFSINLQVAEGIPSLSGEPLNFPNPFNPENGPTKISYNLTGKMPIAIYIFDYSFRPVYKKHFSEGETGAQTGYNEITWDGRDLSGKIVPNGVYFAKLVSGTRLIGKLKIVVLR